MKSFATSTRAREGKIVGVAWRCMVRHYKRARGGIPKSGDTLPIRQYALARGGLSTIYPPPMRTTAVTQRKPTGNPLDWLASPESGRPKSGLQHVVSRCLHGACMVPARRWQRNTMQRHATPRHAATVKGVPV